MKAREPTTKTSKKLTTRPVTRMETVEGGRTPGGSVASEAGVPLSFRCSSSQIKMKGKAGDGRRAGEVMEGEVMEGDMRRGMRR